MANNSVITSNSFHVISLTLRLDEMGSIHMFQRLVVLSLAYVVKTGKLEKLNSLLSLFRDGQAVQSQASVKLIG